MKCSKMDKDSLEFLKSTGKKYNCEECIKKVKTGRHDDTPIKDTAHKTKEIDNKSIIDKLDQVLSNQVTTNNSLQALNNRVIELDRTGATFCEALGKTYFTYLTNNAITI